MGNSIQSLFAIEKRFLRSAHLERDFTDPHALEGYVVTDAVKAALERIIAGLKDGSGQRAWRVTGNYGSGKSTLALLIAHILSGRYNELPNRLRSELKLDSKTLSRATCLPILITGSRTALLEATFKGLIDSIERFDLKINSRVSLLIKSCDKLIKSNSIDEDSICELIRILNKELKKFSEFDGVLLIFDELGKFLEYASLHPEKQDIFFLQRIAEMSSRSGRTPMFTIGLLHQGFQAYSDQLIT